MGGVGRSRPRHRYCLPNVDFFGQIERVRRTRVAVASPIVKGVASLTRIWVTNIRVITPVTVQAVDVVAIKFTVSVCLEGITTRATITTAGVVITSGTVGSFVRADITKRAGKVITSFTKVTLSGHAITGFAI